MDDWDAERMEAFATQALDAPRIRYFPFLGDWAIVVAPLKYFDSRVLLWAYLRGMYEFRDSELVELRARTFEDDDGNPMTYWVTAIRPEGVRRRRRPTAGI